MGFDMMGHKPTDWCSNPPQRYLVGFLFGKIKRLFYLFFLFFFLYVLFPERGQKSISTAVWGKGGGFFLVFLGEGGRGGDPFPEAIQLLYSCAG